MSISNSIRAQIPPIHPEGYPFIGGFALASLILFWIWTRVGWIGTPQGRIGVVQIAGLVARRIVCFAKERQAIGAGERFGLIRFGSRLDVYLPDGAKPLVSEGQTAVAGETVLADFRAGDAGRTYRAD